MRRLLLTVVTATALSACGGSGTPGDRPEATTAAEPAAEPQPSLPAGFPGARSVDRARGAVSATEERALRHDTIR